MADTGGHAGEGTNQILTESDDAQQDRAQHDHKQVAQSAGNAFDDGVRLAVSAHKMYSTQKPYMYSRSPIRLLREE